MFYKITKDNIAVDVFTDVVACKYEPRSKCILGCGIDDDPMGVVSERRDTYYHVYGWTDFPFECQTVVLSNISESEYMELKKQFDKEDADSKAIKEVKDDLIKTSDAMAITFVTLAEKGDIDEVTSSEHTELFSEWAVGIAYAIGNVRKRGGNLYKCLQAHTSQDGWEPENAQSLWKKIGDPAVEYPEWSQPVGAGDAYMMGDKVSYNGTHWVSIVDNNVWMPGVYGWQEVNV